jgi:hypothetical protein
MPPARSSSGEGIAVLGGKAGGSVPTVVRLLALIGLLASVFASGSLASAVPLGGRSMDRLRASTVEGADCATLYQEGLIDAAGNVVVGEADLVARIPTLDLTTGGDVTGLAKLLLDGGCAGFQDSSVAADAPAGRDVEYLDSSDTGDSVKVIDSDDLKDPTGWDGTFDATDGIVIKDPDSSDGKGDDGVVIIDSIDAIDGKDPGDDGGVIIDPVDGSFDSTDRVDAVDADDSTDGTDSAGDDATDATESTDGDTGQAAILEASVSGCIIPGALTGTVELENIGDDHWLHLNLFATAPASRVQPLNLLSTSVPLAPGATAYELDEQIDEVLAHLPGEQLESELSIELMYLNDPVDSRVVPGIECVAAGDTTDGTDSGEPACVVLALELPLDELLTVEVDAADTKLIDALENMLFFPRENRQCGADPNTCVGILAHVQDEPIELALNIGNLDPDDVRAALEEAGYTATDLCGTSDSTDASDGADATDDSGDATDTTDATDATDGSGTGCVVYGLDVPGETVTVDVDESDDAAKALLEGYGFSRRANDACGSIRGEVLHVQVAVAGEWVVVPVDIGALDAVAVTEMLEVAGVAVLNDPRGEDASDDGDGADTTDDASDAGDATDGSGSGCVVLGRSVGGYGPATVDVDRSDVDLMAALRARGFAEQAGAECGTGTGDCLALELPVGGEGADIELNLGTLHADSTIAVLRAAGFTVHGACDTGSTDATDATDTADGTDAMEVTDAADGTDATDATDAIDMTDSTDAVDITDATDATDAMDATDGVDTTDATDADDVADATDATDGDDTIDASDTTDAVDITDGDDGTQQGQLELLLRDQNGNPVSGAVFEIERLEVGVTLDTSAVNALRAQPAGTEPDIDEGGRLVYTLDAGLYLVTEIHAAAGCELAEPFDAAIAAGETATFTVTHACETADGADTADTTDGAADGGKNHDGEKDGAKTTKTSDATGKKTDAGKVTTLPSTGQGPGDQSSDTAITIVAGILSLMLLTAATLVIRGRSPARRA